MTFAKKDYRNRLLRPLRLIHPLHHEDPLYKECYERFFHTTGILKTSKVLSEVAKMQPLIQYRRGFTKRDDKRFEEADSNEGHNDIEAPSKETMERIDDILGMLKPSDFDTAGFDDDSVEITHESLITDIYGSEQLVSLS